MMELWVFPAGSQDLPPWMGYFVSSVPRCFLSRAAAWTLNWMCSLSSSQRGTRYMTGFRATTCPLWWDIYSTSQASQLKPKVFTASTMPVLNLISWDALCLVHFMLLSIPTGSVLHPFLFLPIARHMPPSRADSGDWQRVPDIFWH